MRSNGLATPLRLLSKTIWNWRKKMSAIIAKIARKGSDKEKIARKVVAKPALLPELFEGLNSERAAEKFGCAKVLLLLSEMTPEILYPQFDMVAKLLDCENRLLKWGAIQMVANLVRVDAEHKFDALFERYFAAIRGAEMITAANTIRGASTIALSRPDLAGKICAEILNVERAKYQTKECVNIACGYAIDAFGGFFETIENKDAVLKFVKRQMKNTRPAVQKRAVKFLKKHAGE